MPAGSKLCPVSPKGRWWVQDFAATLPAMLLGDVAGKRVIDLCAAPGGKTVAARVSGRARHRRRCCARSPGADPRKSRARELSTPNSSKPMRAIGGRRARAVRSSRCAVRRDRHDPPSSRSSVDQERGRSDDLGTLAERASRCGRGTDRPGRHAGLCGLFARARRRPGAGGLIPPSADGFRPRADCAGGCV